MVAAALMAPDDDADAPDGCAALRLLRGAPVLRWSVAALATAAPDRLLVITPPSLAMAARRAVQGLAAEVVPAPGIGTGHRLRAVLQASRRAGDGAYRDGDDDLVVLHDPLYPLASGSQVALLAAALRDAGPESAAAVPVHPLTETVKRVTPDRLVHETVDRTGFVVTATPQLFRPAPLQAALDRASDVELMLTDPASLADLLLRGGDLVLPVLVDEAGPRVCSADALDRVAASLR
jgi:2-C-methyl-D-erythritol 4-phosphate cytidylyltransferase